MVLALYVKVTGACLAPFLAVIPMTRSVSPALRRSRKNWVRLRPRQRLPPAALTLWEPRIRASLAVITCRVRLSFAASLVHGPRGGNVASASPPIVEQPIVGSPSDESCVEGQNRCGQRIRSTPGSRETKIQIVELLLTHRSQRQRRSIEM